jgi:phage shock protein A
VTFLLVYWSTWPLCPLGERRLCLAGKVALESEPMMGQELPRLAARLEEVRSGIAALAQSRERVQAQIAVLEHQEAKLGGQAAKARQMGREDLARAALARQREAESQRAELAVQLDQLLGEEAKLTIAAQRWQARKARIYWFGLEAEDREDGFDTNIGP